MSFTKRKKKQKDYLPSLLRPHEVHMLMKALDLNWSEERVNHKGWVNIYNPFENESRPQFSINIYHGGFADHTKKSRKGDIITLIQLLKNMSKIKAEKWALSIINLDIKLAQHIGRGD